MVFMHIDPYYTGETEYINLPVRYLCLILQKPSKLHLKGQASCNWKPSSCLYKIMYVCVYVFVFVCVCVCVFSVLRSCLEMRLSFSV